jgi:aminopeptidase Y
MAGAHLDSFPSSPGINDNGSGAAAILEIAVQMQKVKPRNKLRFALWTAEVQGREGSAYYVSQLSPAEQDRIALYLNFDIIGSPNYGLFIYDGDNSDAVGGPGPGGSDDIEQTFADFFDRFNLPHRGIPFNSPTDHLPFAAAGIPGGGLFTGADDAKTPEQVGLWGGTAGVAFDPCYREACDTYDNVSLFALDINSDAAAVAILKYAMSTEAINGIRGKNLKWRKAKK